MKEHHEAWTRVSQQKSKRRQSEGDSGTGSCRVPQAMVRNTDCILYMIGSSYRV